MELTLSRDPFLKALGRIQSVVERRNTQPILSNALLQAEGNLLVLSATDNEVSVRTEFEVEVELPGQLAVPARKLLEVVQKLPDQPIFLKADDNDRLLVRCGKIRYNLLCLPGEEFPRLPQPDEGPHLPMPAGIFCHLLDKCHFAMSTDETRYTLNGVFFQVEPQEGRYIARVVATDTHRLAVAQRDLPENIQIPEELRDVIIPRKAVAEIRGMLKEEDVMVEVVLGKSFIQVIKPGFTLISKLVDGRYPNFRRAIPVDNVHLMTVGKSPFQELVRRMTVISTEKTHSIQMLIEQDLMKVTSNNPEQEAGEEELETVYAGPAMTLGLSARYLLEIFNAMDGESVRFALLDQDSAVLVTDPDNDEYLFVLMPMQ